MDLHAQEFVHILDLTFNNYVTDPVQDMQSKWNNSVCFIYMTPAFSFPCVAIFNKSKCKYIQMMVQLIQSHILTNPISYIALYILLRSMELTTLLPITIQLVTVTFINVHQLHAYVTGFVKRGLIHAIINIQKYNFEIFNSKYLKNDQSCQQVFLHKFIAIQGNSLRLLCTGQLTEFISILDSFYQRS